MNEETPISPEWLESKGFILKGEDEAGDNWAHDIDYPINEGDLCYVEKELDRYQFAIILVPSEYRGGEKYFYFTVLVRDDIGCGWVPIPSGFTEMTVYHFSLLYEAIRRQKL